MIRVNGKEYDFEEMTIEELLLKLDYPLTRIAVERNQEIVSKKSYGEVKTKDGDVIEVVRFVGGG